MLFNLRSVFAVSVLFCTFSVSIGEAQISNAVGLLRADVSASDGSPLANIPIAIYKGTERISSGKTSAEGTFKTIVQQKATYRVAYNSTDYGYHEDTLVVPALSKYQEFTVHTVLSSIHDGQYFPLDVPVFHPKSSTVEGDAAHQLDEIVALMKHNPKLKLGVTVYPDAPIRSKKDAAQQKIVDARATAVRSYLLGKGVSSNMFDVTESMAVPAGRFPNTFAATTEESGGKKKKKSKAVEQPALIPQYIDIVAHLNR